MKSNIPMWFALMIVLVSSNRQIFGAKITFESFEQTLGEDILALDLRVRKYNRTSSVLNGTVHLVQEGINDYTLQLDLFYSRLGNQQFNHMPMKLPTAGICDFVDEFYERYGDYISIIVNAPEKGECPIKPRDMYILDAEFPTEAIPQLLIRNGLWKTLIRGFYSGKEIVSCFLILKATDN